MGRKPLKKENDVAQATLNCLCCNDELDIKDFYDSDSKIYSSNGKAPYCKRCLEELYEYYVIKYKDFGYANPDRKSIERICMILDLYYSDKVFDSAVKQSEKKNLSDTPLISLYMKQVKLIQYKSKNYDTTLQERYAEAKEENAKISIYTDDDTVKSEEIRRGIELFGEGFSEDDYIYLCREYGDWTTRHECNTKAQEQLFKQICHAQLNLLKAERSGADTKDINAFSKTFQDLLESANLKPKQNVGDAISDAQTFGTLIDKWENTRPIPEIDAELADVDGLGLFVDVLMRGHLAKTAGISSGYGDQYDEFMRKYSVEREEYLDDEDNNAIYEALFGSSLTVDESSDA